MDITVSDKSGSLLWYLEVKEKAIEVPGLVAKLRQYGVDGVDLNAPDRGNDPLRKAKYLVRYTPDYLSVSAIGVRQDFQVVARDSSHFTLVPDMVPFG
jgi:hypothetical protein